MFDKILGKTEEAMVQLSKTLSGFEQEFSKLKTTYESQLADLHRKYEKDFQDFLDKTAATVSFNKKDYEEFLDQHRLDMAKIFVQQSDHLRDLIDIELKKFSGEVKGKIESIYKACEDQTKTSIEHSFETDLLKMFEKYGDKIAPIITKSMVRNFLKIGKK